MAPEWLGSAKDTPSGGPARAHALTGQGLIGKRVSHYRVLEAIGGGGMGNGAIKLNISNWAAGSRSNSCRKSSPAIQPRRSYLNAKRKLASALNHPNICTI